MIFLPLMIVWARRPMRFPTLTRWSFLLVFAGALTFAAPQTPASDPSADRTSNDPVAISDREAVSGPGPGLSRHREGSRVANLVGSFREVGRRWTFTPESNQSGYRVLENQSLQRIVQAIEEDPADTRWKISGTLTEFYDENFLLIHRVERASSTGP